MNGIYTYHRPLKVLTILIRLDMESLSEQTLAGLTDKEVKQLAKRCPIVMTVTEDILLERFEYIDELQTDRSHILADMKMDLKDAQVCVLQLIYNFL